MGTEQARNSSARISASFGLPNSVRSPHRTSTSAVREISPNSSRSAGGLSSLTCRSPSEATLSLLFVIAPFSFAAHVGEPPFVDGDLVVDAGEHAAAADLHLRRRQFELVLEAIEQLVHQPARNMVALGRIDPAEVEQVHQQHLPVLLHVGQQPLPVDGLVLREDEMDDVGAVIAVAQLDERLRPDELGGADHRHRHPENFRLAGMREPCVADRHGAVGRGEDDVEKIFALAHLGDPPLVLDLDRIAEVLEARENARVVAGAAEDIEVLGRTADPRIGADRIGAGQQHRQVRVLELAQNLGVEGFRLRRGCHRRRRTAEDRDRSRARALMCRHGKFGWLAVWTQPRRGGESSIGRAVGGKACLRASGARVFSSAVRSRPAHHVRRGGPRGHGAFQPSRGLMTRRSAPLPTLRRFSIVAGGRKRMNIPEKPRRDAQAQAVDVNRFRLRSFVESLGPDELERRHERVDLADVADIFEANPRAVWFSAVGPEPQELVGNVTGSRRRIAQAFGVAPNALTAEIQRRLRQAPVIVGVTRQEAPCQEVVLTGDDADLTALPVHLQHGSDGAPYISSSIDYVIDRRTGWTNVGVRRLMLRGRREAGIDLVSPSDLRALYEASAGAGQTLPVSFVVGAHPIDHVAATMRFPVDELGLVASLRDAPLPVVKCVTNDIRVPADAEYVLEGFLDARGHVEPEGPYGEFLGYYGALKRNPVFHLTAITRRKDALFQTSTIGGRALGRTDTALLNAIRTELMIWRALETAVREPLAVYATPASGGMFNMRVSLRQRVPGEARNAIAACFGALVNVKNVFVVDPDIDIFSDEQMDWALATRFQPDRDLVVVSGLRTLPLDPSLNPGTRTGAKAGFDLTWPFGTGARLEAAVPEPPRFSGPRFASLEAALAHGPKTFEDLMSAVGSRDGREVVRAVEALRHSMDVDRDDEGRYVAKPRTGGNRS